MLLSCVDKKMHSEIHKFTYRLKKKRPTPKNLIVHVSKNSKLVNEAKLNFEHLTPKQHFPYHTQERESKKSRHY